MTKKRESLIALRKLRGWKQIDIAERVGITDAYYGMIERGVRTPRLPIALALERVFGVPVSALFPELFYAQKPNEMLGSTGTED